LPVAVLPDWLIGNPELAVIFERIARAHAVVSEEKRVWSVDFLDTYTGLLEVKAGLRERESQPIAEPEPSAPVRATAIDDTRVAVIRFGKLDRNARRRAQRWIARQPRGPEHPIVRLRLGRRFKGSKESDMDFLDVARPEARPWDGSPYSWAETIFREMRAAIWTDRTKLPHIGAYVPLCSHHRGDAPGAATTMAAYPDGRLAVYLYEMA